MTSLPTNTTDRLLAVADEIEAHADLFDMDSFYGYTDGESSLNCTVGNLGIGVNECHTTACIAGWAIRFTPESAVEEVGYIDTLELATKTLGLDRGLAETLFFMYGLTEHPRLVAKILRAIATLPEGERTLDSAEAVMPPMPTRELLMEWMENRSMFERLGTTA